MNAQLVLMDHSVLTSVTARTVPSATTSMEPVFATKASRAQAARTASVPQACTDYSATNTARAKLKPHSGIELLVSEPITMSIFLYCLTKNESKKVVFELL